MGQKVHPYGFRIGITEPWMSVWYKKKGYAEQLHEDLFIRSFVEKHLSGPGVSGISIERSANKIKINIRTPKPGLVIGKGGKDIEALRSGIKAKIFKDVVINIIEVRKPDLDAKLVAQQVCKRFEQRAAYKRVVKDAIAKAIRMGAVGAKIAVSGRVGGAEIARTEKYREKRMPLHTLRAKID